MMVTLKLKKLIEQLPESLARPVVWVPFWMRLGSFYVNSTREIAHAQVANESDLSSLTFRKLQSIVRYAYAQVPFYRERYRLAGFDPADLREPSDWQHVPRIAKSDLQQIPLCDRTGSDAGALSSNTGGTSGQPLEFLLERHAFAREWAHMHWIWKAHGYQPHHLKLTFRGKHFDRRMPLRFNAVHNEYIVNANCPLDEVVRALAKLPSAKRIRWLHGYPSLIAEFATALRDCGSDAGDALRQRLYGVLLGSEYPAPHYRQKIESLLSTNIVSWYGHSEMAVLARETAREVYESMPTYGFAEAVRDVPGQACRLICTSFHNTAHPFIRYDTGDLIEPISQSGGSLAFRIVEGRLGDFILDRSGTKHSLTAIVFGRHHPAFDAIKHIQVRQDTIGKVTFLVTPLSDQEKAATIRARLDFDDLDLDWQVEILREPVRTKAGKIRLKVETI